VPVDLWKNVRISSITIDTERCITYRDVECGVCAHACPVGEAALRMDGRRHPQLGPDCTGCGVCISACVTTPSSISSTVIGRPS
jgi:ferredoxin-type protein NapG